MLGSSEGISNADNLFAIADKKNRIYKSKPTSSKMNNHLFTGSHLRTQKNESSSLTKYREPASETDLERLADRTVLSRYAPVGVMIDEDLEILQFRGQTSAYLEPAPGKASLNLLKMANASLRLELRSVISKVKEQGISISKDGIEMEGDVIVKIDVIPLVLNGNRYFLILFESSSQQRLLAPAQTDRRATPPQDGASRDVEMASLTHQLAQTKEYLRAIIESQETNNQDLKVAGEELLSSNEELQSANEELETAKEEIQATNEELSTINDELRIGNDQLHDVNNDMQNLLSSVNIPILMLSGDLRIRRFTPMAEQAFNLIASDVGRPFSQIKNNLDVPNIQTLMTSVIDTLIPYEQNIQDHDGDWYILRIRPYRTTDNRIDGVVVGLIDINLLQRKTIELEASRNYATAIIETLHQPLIVLNSQMEVVTANHAFYTVFQTTSHQTERQSIFALNQGAWNTPKLRSLLNEILLMDFTVQDYEITQNFPQIGTRTVLLNACQIDQPNTGQMILIAIEDITERNDQKQQLTVNNQKLSAAMITSEAANIAKSEFLGNMSHELRTPLNSIMGFSQLLQDSETLDPESRQYLEIIYQSGAHLLSLIEDLLDITRIEAEKMTIEPNFLALAEFLDVTVSMVLAKAIAKNLNLTTQFAADLPKTIYADEKRLRQILLNLLSNAIKFTDTGNISLAVSKGQSINQAGNPCESIRFAVIDTGVGMAAADAEKIFLPFEQVGDAKTKYQGTGLGLAISQNLAKQMESEIKVTSQPNVGSTFSFELDLISSQDQTQDQSLIMPEKVSPAIAPSLQSDRLLAPASQQE
jgi:two-component system CheB/CheR fusion protein